MLLDEIRRSPVEVGSLSHYLRAFYRSQVVVWDLFSTSIFFCKAGGNIFC